MTTNVHDLVKSLLALQMMGFIEGEKYHGLFEK